jgi:hypothetical protein
LIKFTAPKVKQHIILKFHNCHILKCVFEYFFSVHFLTSSITGYFGAQQDTLFSVSTSLKQNIQVSSYEVYRISRQKCTLNTNVASRPVANQLLCKQQPFLGNGSVSTFRTVQQNHNNSTAGLQQWKRGILYVVRAEMLKPGGLELSQGT